MVKKEGICNMLQMVMEEKKMKVESKSNHFK